jgi:DNA-binding NarL/FixJ family response regulator
MTPSGDIASRATYMHNNFDKEDAKEARKIKEEVSISKKEAAIELRKEGRTIKEIAELVKRSERTVKRYLGN